jgi:hypothetical protein
MPTHGYLPILSWVTTYVGEGMGQHSGTHGFTHAIASGNSRVCNLFRGDLELTWKTKLIFRLESSYGNEQAYIPEGMGMYGVVASNQ